MRLEFKRFTKILCWTSFYIR